MKLASGVETVGKWRGGNFNRFGQFPGRVWPRLFAGKPRQFQRFASGFRNLVEKLTHPDDRGAHPMRKRPLETLPKRVPIRLALQNKVPHPAVAALEHLNQQLFHLLPAVVAPQQQLFDGRAELRAGLVDFPESFAGCSSIGLIGLFANLQASAEAREQGLLQSQIATK